MRRPAGSSTISDRRAPAGRKRDRQGIAFAVAAALLYLLVASNIASSQEVLISTTVAPLGAGAATSHLSINTVKAAPATERGLVLPSLAITDDGSGPQVRSLMLQMPKFDLGAASVASTVGDQRLPSVIRDATLAGPALGSSARGLTLAMNGGAPLTISFAQLPALGSVGSNAPALAAAALSFNPTSRLSVTPTLLIPGGAPAAQRSVGTAIRANVADGVSVTSDVGLADTATSAWTPTGSARLSGQWSKGGIETVVLRGAAAPPTGTRTAFVSSRDREAAQAHLQPLKGLTVAALTSASRPSADPVAADTTLESIRLAYDRLPNGQLAAVQQREVTASRETDLTSLEWRQRGAGRMAVRFVRETASDSASAGVDRTSSRFELELPTLARNSVNGLDLRAALTAGAITPTDSGVSSKVSGRLALTNAAVLTGETDLGLTNRDAQLLRSLRVTTEVPLVEATQLQLSYAYRTGTQFPVGQVFEARILRRVRLGW